MADDDLQALRRRHAAGEDVAGLLVRALVRAGRFAEVVADHGRRTRDGGPLGDDVEAAWRAVLPTLRRVREWPDTPIDRGAWPQCWAGERAVYLVEHVLESRLLDLERGPEDAVPMRSCASFDGGVFALDADDTLVTIPARAGPLVRGTLLGRRRREDPMVGEWLHGASPDGERLLLHEQYLGSCSGRIVRRADGTTIDELGAVHRYFIDWERDRVLVQGWQGRGGLARRQLSDPTAPLVSLPGPQARLELLRDGRLILTQGEVRLLDPDAGTIEPVTGPPGIVEVTLAPDGLALLAIDHAGALLRLPITAEGQGACWHDRDVGFDMLGSVGSSDWHPWAAAALIARGGQLALRAVDGATLTTFDHREPLAWTPDGSGLLLLRLEGTGESGVVELWRVTGNSPPPSGV